jgi:ferredoxin
MADDPDHLALDSAPDGVLPRAQLDALIGALRAAGYAVHGPVARDGAIVIAPLQQAAELPAGWTAEQAPGRYRLERRPDAALFGFTHGADSWKKLLYPARIQLWSAERTTDGFAVQLPAPPAQPLALFGVRGCDLRAIAVQDRVLLGGQHIDAVYAARRRDAFILAVDCATPSATCFCTSMGAGPTAGPGYDLALTELDAALPERHRFLLRVGSPRGQAIADGLGLAPAAPDDAPAAAEQAAAARALIGRAMPADARERLSAGREGPHWEAVAARCLGCANCTMVCPTCFCTSVEDTSDLTGDHAERWRSWDSCFTFAFTTMGGAPVRESTAARYRHWVSHKLATWHEQFGESGCVGCGRCIAWCPVGIDITAEVTSLPAEGSTR